MSNTRVKIGSIVQNQLPDFVQEEYALAIAKDNDELLEKVNDALATLKESGKLQEIIDKYIVAE